MIHVIANPIVYLRLNYNISIYKYYYFLWEVMFWVSLFVFLIIPKVMKRFAYLGKDWPKEEMMKLKF